MIGVGTGARWPSQVGALKSSDHARRSHCEPQSRLFMGGKCNAVTSYICFRPVLGCSDASDSESRLIFQHFSRSIKSSSSHSNGPTFSSFLVRSLRPMRAKKNIEKMLTKKFGLENGHKRIQSSFS